MKANKAKPKWTLPVTGPFAPAVLSRAREIVDGYGIVLEREPDLGYVGHAVEFPTAWGDGRTPNACMKATREALMAAVATMIEMGQDPPIGSSGRRSEQINIRVTREEKLRLERVARSKGFRGVSDYVRTAGLSGG